MHAEGDYGREHKPHAAKLCSFRNNLLLSFSDSLAPVLHLHRRSPAPALPPLPPRPPRQRRRSFCLKILSCRCMPATQWAVRTSSSLLQDKVSHTHTHVHTHTHTYSIFINPVFVLFIASSFLFLLCLYIFHINVTKCLLISTKVYFSFMLILS